MPLVFPYAKLILFVISYKSGAVTRDELAENYGIDNSSWALFNIFIQGSKHYEGFSTKINDSMKLEQEHLRKIGEGRATTLIDMNRVYIQNVGCLFIESIDLSL